ncbi:Tfp pilus assembly protein FimT/FimU, partial [Thermodesulfobacteriota bacterium]
MNRNPIGTICVNEGLKIRNFRLVKNLAAGNAKGYTFADLIIVTLILGILATVTVPTFNSLAHEMKLDGAATEVVLALQYARSLAVRYQKPFEVRAYRYNYGSGKANQFLIKDPSAPDSLMHLDAEPPLYTYGRVFHPLDKKPYIIDFNDIQSALDGVIEPKREYESVDFTYVPGGGIDGTIRFYPDGHSSDTDNTIVLTLG